MGQGICFTMGIQTILTLAAASALYVAPLGSDQTGDGSIAKPYKTAAHAASAAKAGTTVILLTGVFPETSPVILPPRVSLQGAGKDKSILKASLASDYLISARSSQLEEGSQTLSGFTIDGTARQLRGGVFAENRHGVEVRGLRLKDIREAGVLIDTFAGTWRTEASPLLERVRVEDSQFTNCGFDFPEYSGGSLEIGGLEGGLVKGIDVVSQHGYGIKFATNGFFRRTKVTDCRITLRETDRLWGEPISVELWNLGPGNEVSRIRANTWLSLVNHAGVFAQPKGYENLLVSDVQVIDKDGESGKEGLELGVPGTRLTKVVLENKGFGVAIWDSGNRQILIENSTIRSSKKRENWAGGAGAFIANSRDIPFRDIIIRGCLIQGATTGILLSCDSAAGFDGITVEGSEFRGLHGPALDFRGTKGFGVDAIRNVALLRNRVDKSILELGPGARNHPAVRISRGS